MKILAIDDEITALKILKRAIESATPNAEICCFGLPSAAIKEIEENDYRFDVAFIDIEMPGMNGLEFAIKLKKISPQTNIVFSTGFSQYALDAYGIHASGYIMKPITAEKIIAELHNLRVKPKQNENEKNGKKLTVKTFQNFEVYADGKVVNFSRSKAKEIFAYLIDRNGTCAAAAEIAAAIWEDGIYDRSRQNQLQVFISEIKKSLAEVGAEDVLIKTSTGLMIDTTKIDCDMYRQLQGDIDALNEYRGEYMASYSWAELSVGKFNV